MGLAHSPAIITNGLSCYLDAGNPKSYSGSGTAWNDISGNGRNFTWATTPTFTSSGAGSYFATTNKQCDGPASNSFGINNTSGYTIFLVSKNVTTTQNYAFYFAQASERAISTHHTWSDGHIYFDQGGCCGTSQRTSVLNVNLLSWNVTCYTSNITNRKVIKDGVVLGTNTVSAANLDLVSTGVRINFVTGGLNWDAHLSSFIVYNRGLSDNEIKQNYEALRGRFGI